ncbi:substrate-binding domain-containing protein [Desulfovibrio aminophilus]|uniref:substrate-binding domain-containing protein n=1 Tax=Desulfovibrio aminophilus TaxID=81425 RepID=UPI00146EACA1|nr:substrate-binding domain-containing protein [Desulfovibrio aminophilus]
MNRIVRIPAILLLLTLSCCAWRWVMAQSSPLPAGESLRVYGPGGPYPAMKECAALYSARAGIPVEVVKGQPDLLVEAVRSDGDLFYNGAEYMMDDFLAAHPGVLDAAGVTPLFARRMGIIVRAGNPKAIAVPEDLRKPGVAVLDVRLENMAGPRHDPPQGLPGVALSVVTGEQGFAAWKERPDLDAWVTYRTWHAQLTDGSLFLPLPGAEGLRSVVAAEVIGARHPEEARRFRDWLTSKEARAVFVRHGFE